MADAPYGLSGSPSGCHCSSSLLVLEPVITFVLGALALLGVLTALFWKFFGPPNFPFFLMLGISLGFELAVIVYRKLLRFLA